MIFLSITRVNTVNRCGGAKLFILTHNRSTGVLRDHKPEFSPGFEIKNGGKFLVPEINLKILLSEMFHFCHIEIAIKSKINASGLSAENSQFDII